MACIFSEDSNLSTYFGEKTVKEIKNQGIFDYWNGFKWIKAKLVEVEPPEKIYEVNVNVIKDYENDILIHDTSIIRVSSDVLLPTIDGVNCREVPLEKIKTKKYLYNYSLVDLDLPYNPLEEEFSYIISCVSKIHEVKETTQENDEKFFSIEGAYKNPDYVLVNNVLLVNN